MAHWLQTRFGAAKSEATGCRARHRTSAAGTSVQALTLRFPKAASAASPFVNGPYRPGVIETERLLLRSWQPADEAPFAALNADPQVTRFLGGPMSRDQTDELLARIRSHWQQHGFGLYAVEVKDSGAFIGFIGLAIPSFLPDVLPAVEVGWRLAREHWGKGYATEGARASVRFGFDELALRQIISIIDPGNTASIRVAERLEMARGRDRIHPVSRARLSIYVKNAEDAGSSLAAP